MGTKRPIFYSALLLTGVNLLLRLTGTWFQVSIGRTMGAAGVGLLQLTLSVGSFALVAGTAGIRTAAMYLTAEEQGRNRGSSIRAVVSGCLGYSSLFSLAAAALLWLGAPVFAARWVGNPETAAALRLFAGFLPVSCLCGVMTGYFTGTGRIGTLAAVEVAEQLACIGMTTLLLSFPWVRDPPRACGAVILGSGLGSCMTLTVLVILYRLERHGPARLPGLSRRLRDTALPLGLGDMLRTGIRTLEDLTVPKRLALYPAIGDPLAAFGQLGGMVFPVVMFPACILFGLAELLIPELSRCEAAGSLTRRRYLIRKTLRITAIYSLGVGGLLYLLAEELWVGLYRTGEGAGYMECYALLVPMLYCDCIVDAMTKGLGQQKANVRYNIITNILDVALLFVLLPKYGMAGYFFSFTVTHLLNFGLSFRRLLMICGEKPPFYPGALAIGCAVFSLGAARTVPAAPLRAGGFLALYFSSLYLTKVIGQRDLTWLRGLVRGAGGEA